MHLTPRWSVSTWHWVTVLGIKTLEWWGYLTDKEVWRYLQPSGYNTRMWRTDTDRQQRPRLRIASRGNNRLAREICETMLKSEMNVLWYHACMWSRSMRQHKSVVYVVCQRRRTAPSFLYLGSTDFEHVITASLQRDDAIDDDVKCKCSGECLTCTQKLSSVCAWNRRLATAIRSRVSILVT